MTDLAASASRAVKRDEKPARGAAIDIRFLLETLTCDLSWSLMQAAALSVLTQACARSDSSWTLWTWRHQLADEGASMKLALRYGGELGLSGEVTAKIIAFYDDLAKQKLRIAPLTQARVYSASERRALAEAAPEFARLATRAGATVVGIEPIVTRLLGSPYTDDLRTIAAFLREAATGSGARVDAHGRLTMPELSQRRRTPRARISIACRLEAGGLSAPATMEDISRGGAGVRCRQAFAAEQRLTVVFADGRQLEAVVRRQEGDRHGLSFMSQIDSNDPLFRQA